MEANLHQDIWREGREEGRELREGGRDGEGDGGALWFLDAGLDRAYGLVYHEWAVAVAQGCSSGRARGRRSRTCGRSEREEILHERTSLQAELNAEIARREAAQEGSQESGGRGRSERGTRLLAIEHVVFRRALRS